MQRQRLIDSFVNSIYLFDDKLVVTFYYKDGTKTLPLSEIKSTIANKNVCSDMGEDKPPPAWPEQ